jgi:hypothetical protein
MIEMLSEHERPDIIDVDFKTQAIIREISFNMQNERMVEGFSVEDIQEMLNDVSNQDLMLATSIAALMNPAHGEDSLQAYYYRSGTTGVVVKRLEELGYRGFTARGLVPASEEVVNAFKKYRPELENLPIEIAITNEDCIRVVSEAIKRSSTEGDIAVIIGEEHKSGVYIHRGENAKTIFLFDSVGKMN